jgi:hypothetical protein
MKSRTIKGLVGLLIMAAISVTMCVVMPFSEAGVTLAMPAVTLSTQKIVFLTSLKEEYEKIDTWLNEAEDLSTFVESGQTLVFPEAGQDPSVYKNRTTDVDSVEPTETVYKSELDVYDSQNYKIRNIYLHALPFEKIQYYTRKSANAIIKQEIEDAAYSYAPDSAGAKKIVIPTTGALRGGLKMMILDDIVTLARACDNASFPDGRNLVLTSDMWWDLVNNNAILKGQLERSQQNGIIAPHIVEYYGIKIHKTLGNSLGITYDIDGEEKAPQGTAINVAGDIVPAALLFCKNQVYKAGGNMEMFYQEKSSNTSGRAYEFGFQHRFKADFQMSAQRYSGLIYAAKG